MDNIHTQPKIATIETLRPKRRLPRWIPISAGLMMSIFFVTAIFLALQSELFTRASDTEPRDIVITQVNPNTARVVWNTGQETQSTIIYGTNPNELSFFSPEIFATRDHSITLTGLTPATTYYFGVKVGDNAPYFDTSNVPWSFITMSDNAQSATTQAVQERIDKTIDTNNAPQQSTDTFPTSKNTSELCPFTDCCTIRQNLGRQGCDTSILLQRNCLSQIEQCQ